MDIALKVVLDYLRDISMPINQKSEIKNVCMVSSNHNEQIATIISEVINKIGIEGIMNIVESPTGMNGFKIVNGLIFNRGYVSNLFV
jgi:chaperonin GroEL